VNNVINTDPEKISAIKDFPLPKSFKALWSILGMVGWYRKFINNYASVTAPLIDLLKPKKKFVMTPEGKESVEALKDMLCLAPVLRSPDFFRPFFVQCDAMCVMMGLNRSYQIKAPSVSPSHSKRFWVNTKFPIAWPLCMLHRQMHPSEWTGQ